MYETDDEVYSIKKESAESGDNCARLSSSIIWWDTSSYEHQRAPGQNSSASKPDICDEVKGLHFGQTGEDQVLWPIQMLCHAQRKQTWEAP